MKKNNRASNKFNVYFQSGVENLYLDIEMADLEIKINNRLFRCHKTVLAAVSPYFRSMFSTGMKESREQRVVLQVNVILGFAQAWKYLNLEGFLEKTLKLNLPWKVLENHSKALKSPWILLFPVGLSTIDGELNQYKIVVPIFGAAYAAPNKGTTILYYYSSTNVSIISV